MTIEEAKALAIRPITFRQASQYVSEHHRHHLPTIGCKFCVGCFVENKMVGVAVCGRPVSRRLDDGITLEINRVCTDGTKNACSKLYGACCRVAKEMGYKQVITYTLASEDGASLKASNFICEGQTGGLEWNGRSKPKNEGIYPHEKKIRWRKTLIQTKGEQ